MATSNAVQQLREAGTVLIADTANFNGNLDL